MDTNIRRDTKRDVNIKKLRDARKTYIKNSLKKRGLV
jgi:hypothetical protein